MPAGRRQITISSSLSVGRQPRPQRTADHLVQRRAAAGGRRTRRRAARAVPASERSSADRVDQHPGADREQRRQDGAQRDAPPTTTRRSRGEHPPHRRREPPLRSTAQPFDHVRHSPHLLHRLEAVAFRRDRVDAAPHRARSPSGQVRVSVRVRGGRGSGAERRDDGEARWSSSGARPPAGPSAPRSPPSSCAAGRSSGRIAHQRTRLGRPRRSTYSVAPSSAPSSQRSPVSSRTSRSAPASASSPRRSLPFGSVHPGAVRLDDQDAPRSARRRPFATPRRPLPRTDHRREANGHAHVRSGDAAADVTRRSHCRMCTTSTPLRCRPSADAAAARHHCPSLVWGVGVGAGGSSRPVRPASSTTAPRRRPRTVYRIASMTKSFTAAAVLALRDDGVLRLDDPITTHAPELATIARHHGRRRADHARAPAVDGVGSRHRRRVGRSPPRHLRRRARRDRRRRVALRGADGHDLRVLEPRLRARRPDRAARHRPARAGPRPRALPRDRSASRARTWVRPTTTTGRGRTDGRTASHAPEELVGDGALAPMGGIWSCVEDLARVERLVRLRLPRARRPRRRAAAACVTARDAGDAQPRRVVRRCAVAPAPQAYGYGLLVRDDPALGRVARRTPAGSRATARTCAGPRGGRVAVVALANVTYAPMAELTLELFDVLHDARRAPAGHRRRSTAELEARGTRLVDLLLDWDDAPRRCAVHRQRRRRRGLRPPARGVRRARRGRPGASRSRRSPRSNAAACDVLLTDAARCLARRSSWRSRRCRRCASSRTRCARRRRPDVDAPS